MKRFAFSLLLYTLLPLSSYASWAGLPLDIGVQTSDLIVIGTLHNVREHSKNEMVYSKGTITVDEVIWGNVISGEELTLTWENRTGVVCPRIEHKSYEHIKAIWLLNFGKEGEVTADHRQRFVRLKDRKKVEKYLLAKKVSSRTSDYWRRKDSPVNITIIFRNPTDTDIQFPGIEEKNGYLYISPDVEINFTLYSHEDETKTRLDSDKIIASLEVLPITVNRGQEYRITFDLKNYFEIRKNESYFLSFKAKGHEPANEISVYLSDDFLSSDTEDSSSDNETANQSARSARSAILPIIGAAFCLVFLCRRRRKTNSWL